MTMTHRRLAALGTGALLAFGAAACNNDKLTDININPNNPADVPAAPLFTNATRVAVGRWLGGGYSLRATEFVTQHLAEVQYPDEDRYSRLTGGSTTTYFDNPYVAELEDYKIVIDKGRASNEAGTWGPADVMQTWVFSYLTNTWGDVPYSETLKGNDEGGTLTPKYDDQQSIYNDFFTRLTSDAAALGSAENALTTADPIYSGDTGKWQRFANSLHARLAMQIINVDPAKANAELTAAFAGGVLTSNSDNAQLVWAGDGVYNNPWADNFKTRDDHRMSNSIMQYLVGWSDPRLAVFAQPTKDDPTKYAGMPNGLTASKAAAYFNTSSRPGEVFYPGQTTYGFFGGGGASYPSYLMTYAEVSFLKAEAANRGIGGFTAAQAAAFYEEGIRASMAQWGVTDPTAIDTYLARPEVVYQTGTEGLRRIAIQKWIALFTDGGTAWSEWRRTCQPSTIIPGPNAIATDVPRRFMYSSTEYSVNSDALNTAIAAQGDDAFETRMWWDTNPDAAPTHVANCGARP